MPRQTSRMRFPFPDEGEDPFYETFREFTDNVDAAAFADADNNNLIATGISIFAWDLATHVLSWDGEFFFDGFTTPFRARVAGPPGTAPGLALAGVGAGNVDDGPQRYFVSFVPAGPEYAAGPSARITVVDKTVNGKVNVTIPLGPPGTVSRKIYRTGAYGFGYKLVTTVADNVTTLYLDNIADAGLGAALAPGIVTSEVSLLEGQIAYFTMPRLTEIDTDVVLNVGTVVAESNGLKIHDKVVVCIRSGDQIYFRNGVTLQDGMSGPVWERPSNPFLVGMTPAQLAAVNSALHSHEVFKFSNLLANLPPASTIITLPNPAPETYKRFEVFKNGQCLTEDPLYDFSANLILWQVTLFVPTVAADLVKIVAEKTKTAPA